MTRTILVYGAGVVFGVLLISYGLLLRHSVSEGQESSIRQRLPPGCAAVDLGPYRDFRDLVAVICSGSRHSIAFNVSGGHQTRGSTVVVDVRR